MTRSSSSPRTRAASSTRSARFTRPTARPPSRRSTGLPPRAPPGSSCTRTPRASTSRSPPSRGGAQGRRARAARAVRRLLAVGRQPAGQVRRPRDAGARVQAHPRPRARPGLPAAAYLRHPRPLPVVAAERVDRHLGHRRDAGRRPVRGAVRLGAAQGRRRPRASSAAITRSTTRRPPCARWPPSASPTRSRPPSCTTTPPSCSTARDRCLSRHGQGSRSGGRPWTPRSSVSAGSRGTSPPAVPGC